MKNFIKVISNVLGKSKDVKAETDAILAIMSPSEMIDQLGKLYPITIVMDRYSGTYSGGEWLAFNLHADEIPSEIHGCDIPCSNFFDETKLPIGKGKSPEEALENLKLL